MKGRLRRAAESVFVSLERAVTAALYPFCLLRRHLRVGKSVPILMYHQVGRPVEDVPACEDCVLPDRFERQIHAILEAGYEVIPLSSLVRALRNGGAGLPARAVVLTFDDGFRGQFVNAYPILRRHRLPATVFVVPGYLGRDSFFRHLGLEDRQGKDIRARPLAWLPLSWDELDEMHRHGFEVGSHSMSHRSLGLLSDAEAEFEAGRSREILEKRLRKPIELFAYPFGSRAYGDFDRDLEEMLGRMGYEAACTTVIGRCASGVDRFALPRIPMENSDTPFRVRCKLAGAYDWMGAVKTLGQRVLARQERVDLGLPFETRSRG